MRKILTVARREYIETAKTRAFQISVFATPLVIGLVLLIATRIEKNIESGPKPARKVAVADVSRELLPSLEASFKSHNDSNPERQILLTPSEATEEENFETQTERLKGEVRDRKLDAFLLIPEGVVEGEEDPLYYRRAGEVADFTEVSTVQRLLNDAVSERRCQLHGVSADVLAEIRKRVSLQQMDVEKQAEEEIEGVSARTFVPFFFLFLMFMGVFGVNQHMLTSVIEEKNSRVIEVLLATVTPFQFMAGKIVGLTAIGLTVITIWGAGCYAAAAYQGLAGLVGIEDFVYFFLFFVLGFTLFSSVFAAIGSACNTVQESQSLMMPITILLVGPMVGWLYFVQHPDGVWATALSFVPPLTPLVMMLRLSARPDLPFLQVVASIAVLAASIPAVMWASAKIFRTGILMHGKPPSFREIVRWVRLK